MSREKQIEGMEMSPLDLLANDIYQHCPDLKENYCGDTHCVACLANALYTAGYRKQEWISVEERLPADEDEIVLAIVSGKPCNNITLCLAYELAVYIEGEGWFIEQYPEWETPEVTYWMPLTEPPKMKGESGNDEKRDLQSLRRSK